MRCKSYLKEQQHDDYEEQQKKRTIDIFNDYVNKKTNITIMSMFHKY